MKLTQLQPMTSLQIAATLNAHRPSHKGVFPIRHDTVLAKIRAILPEASETMELAGTYRNVLRPVFHLTEGQTIKVLQAFRYTEKAVADLLAVREGTSTIATANPAKAIAEAPSAVSVLCIAPVAAEVVAVQDKPLNSVADIGIETGSIAVGDTVQTVNARKLHAFLQSKYQFSNWIQERIAKYGFVENVDFVQAKEKTLAGQTTNEYHVSLNMAKELAMLERSPKGQEARQYFIQCEKKAMGTSPVALPSYSEALRQLASSLENEVRQQAMIDVQQAVLIEQAPSVEFVDKYVGAKGAINFRAVAKLLQANDPTVTELDFRAFLESNRIMYKLSGVWTAFAPHIKAGYFVVKTNVIEGYERSRALFTPAGVKWVTEKWNKRVPVLRK